VISAAYDNSGVKEQHVYMKLCFKLCKTATKILDMLKLAFGEETKRIKGYFVHFES